jgi:ubiquinone/menaquinone biosynthesis C-methylase UbiE
MIRHLPRDDIRTIADLGCGTGRFTSLLAESFPARVYGIEPSGKMLSQARENISSPTTVFLRGTAEEIPLSDNTIDMVLLSMVYHHIQEKNKAVSELTRILKSRGYVCIRTSTRQMLGTYPWLRFFPKAMETELRRAPDRNELVAFFRHNGFDLAAHVEVTQLFSKDHMEYLEKIAARGLSSLQMISDEDFERGLADLEEFCRNQGSGSAVYEEIDFFVFGIGIGAAQ